MYARFRFALQLFTLVKKKQVLAYITSRNNHDNICTHFDFLLLLDC